MKPFQFFGIAVVLVLERQRDGLAIDVLDGGHVHGRGVGTETHRNGQRHRRKEVCGVIFLVDHLVAYQRPAGCLGNFNIQALLFVKTQWVRHDEWRGAGDGDETDLQVGFFKLSFFLRHGLHAGHRQQAGNRRHRRTLAYRAQKAPAHFILRKDSLDQCCFNEFV